MFFSFPRISWTLDSSWVAYWLFLLTNCLLKRAHVCIACVHARDVFAWKKIIIICKNERCSCRAYVIVHGGKREKKKIITGKQRAAVSSGITPFYGVTVNTVWPTRVVIVEYARALSDTMGFIVRCSTSTIGDKVAVSGPIIIVRRRRIMGRPAWRHWAPRWKHSIAMACTTWTAKGIP